MITIISMCHISPICTLVARLAMPVNDELTDCYDNSWCPLSCQSFLVDYNGCEICECDTSICQVERARERDWDVEREGRGRTKVEVVGCFHYRGWFNDW